MKIVARALEQPLREIARNSGEEPSVVVAKVAEGKGNFGFNAQTGEYGDLVSMGVLDPTKVTRFALQNAASVAGLMLTTEAMVAELPKDEKQSMGGPGGGMGGFLSAPAQRDSKFLVCTDSGVLAAPSWHSLLRPPLVAGTAAMPVAAFARRPRAPPFVYPPGYARHGPETTLPYQVVARHFPAFRELREEAGRLVLGVACRTISDAGKCAPDGRLQASPTSFHANTAESCLTCTESLDDLRRSCDPAE